MSSSTKSLQQLYDEERVRTMTLELKSARLETELERLKSLEAASVIRDEAKDQQLQELQMALDDADRPVTSGDDKNVEELQAKNELLSKTNASLEAECTELRECIQALRKDLETMVAVSGHNSESQATAFDGFNQLRQVMEKQVGTYKKVNNARAMIQRRLKPQDEVEDEEVQPPRSTGPLPQASKSLSGPGPKGNASGGVKAPTQSVSIGEAAKTGMKTSVEAAYRGLSTAQNKGKSASANRGPNQESFAKEAASSNPFALLADDEERTPKAAAQAQKTTKSPQPSSTLSSVSQDANKRDQTADSAVRYSQNVPSTKRARSSKSPAPAQASGPAMPQAELQNQGPASKSEATADTKTLTRPKSLLDPQATLFAPAPLKSMAQVAADPPPPSAYYLDDHEAMEALEELQENVPKKVPAKSKISDNKRIQGAVVGTVVEPGKPKPKPKPAAENSVVGTSGEGKSVESSANPLSKLGEKRTIKAVDMKHAGAPIVAPLQQPVTPSHPNETPVKAYTGPKSYASPSASSLPIPKLLSRSVPGKDKAEKSKAMEELDRSLGKMPEKWADMADPGEESEQHGPEGHGALPDEETPNAGASSSRGDQVPASGDGDQAAQKDTGVTKGSPATKDDDVNAKEQGTTVTNIQGEGPSPAELAGTVSPTPAASGSKLPTNTLFQGKKSREESFLPMTHPNDPGKPKRNRNRNRNKLRAQKKIWEQANAEGGSAGAKPTK